MIKLDDGSRCDRADYVGELTDRWVVGDPPPLVGDIVEFDVWDSPQRKCFHLEVVRRTWRRVQAGEWLPSGGLAGGREEAVCRVELHIPSVPTMSIADWETYYKRHVLGRDW